MTVALNRYRAWLADQTLDPQLKNELLTIANEEHEIEERFYTHLSFGTGGLRGELGAGTNRMNIYTIRKATLGLARFLHAKSSLGHSTASNASNPLSVVIAYDCRHLSDRFAQEAAFTLAQENIKAYVYPALRSTPQLSYTVRSLQADAGIVITASHNPPEYNGYKVYGADGAQLNLADAEQVIHYVNQIENERAIQVMNKQEAIDKDLLVILAENHDISYQQYVASLVLRPNVIHQMADAYKIVFTPFHGTGLPAAKEVLTQAGFRQIHIVEQQARPDPDFSSVASPNPEEHAAFELAIDEAKRLKADIIMGTDPDADRMGIVIKDRAGAYQVLTGNQTGALLVHYIVTARKELGNLTKRDTIYKTIVTSELGRKIGEAYGLETIDTLTGFKFIGEQIKLNSENGDRRFIFGYEESYGYLIGDHVRDKDAIQAVLIAAEMGAWYKSQGMSLIDALENIYQQFGYYIEDQIAITLKGKEGLEKIKRVMTLLGTDSPHEMANKSVLLREDYRQGKSVKSDTGEVIPIQLPTSDVLKFILEDEAWCCVRPSGTEPKLKIYLGIKEQSATEAKEAIASFRTWVSRWINQLLDEA